MEAVQLRFSNAFVRNGGELLMQLHALAEAGTKLAEHSKALSKIEKEVRHPCST
jgi:hypothetical protein